MMHASIQCGIVPSNVTKKETHCSHASARAINSSCIHFSVARCIVLIMANASLVSDTLLNKLLSVPFSRMHYMHIHVHVAIIHSRLLLWHIVAPGAVFSSITKA